jgi:hypothetical protein
MTFLISGLTACEQKSLKKNHKSGISSPSKSNLSIDTFALKINKLQSSKMDSLILPVDQTIRINPLNKNLSEITASEAEKEKILLGDYQSIQKSDVLRINGKYVLVILHDKYSDDMRAATFSLDGKPIETILLYSTKGNNDFKINRSYSYRDDVPFRYDSLHNFFQFTDLRYDTEWIEYPVKGKDKLTYKIDFKVKVNDRGGFEKL